ncbi:hypothetical protein P280DRAFT_395332 [Massarina eburnea CBS 473.64]|uniref:Uncharacterized protein n=1 Tax=Massarina eburnea CBS 473.64 TaxID=1395130 RepID=A0A6A6S7J8_9PLEO|nr:hypothetical protein P280DRAFT_395332 [Massarina eburnea CBS 473.64]
MLAKFTAKSKPAPVFNQPVSLQRRYKIARGLHTALLSLLVIFATTVIVLKAMTINFMEDNRDTGFEFQGEGQDVLMAALPKQLYTAPAKLALVAGAISIFVGIGHMLFVVIDWKKGKKTQAYAFRRNLMFLHFSNSVVVLFALVSIYVTHKSSSHFRERYVNFKADRASSADGMRYGVGTFDLETWSCELKTVAGAEMVWEDYAKQCMIETAGRGMMIPFMITGWALCGLSIWMMIGGRRDADGQRIKTEQVELEMGKMNATGED